jgi:hypothetical protein
MRGLRLFSALPLIFGIAACSSEESVDRSNDPFFDEEYDLDETAGSKTSAFGLSKNLGGLIGDFDYCTGALCNSGEGDCDGNFECAEGTTCVANIGLQFGRTPKWDYCLAPTCLNGRLDEGETTRDCGGICGACECVGLVGDAAFCTSGCPCEVGEGDCDLNTQCADELVCGAGNGPAFYFGGDTSSCVAPHCRNRRLDGDETRLDCGGADCGRCWFPFTVETIGSSATVLWYALDSDTSGSDTCTINPVTRRATCTYYYDANSDVEIISRSPGLAYHAHYECTDCVCQLGGSPSRPQIECSFFEVEKASSLQIFWERTPLP